MKPRTTLGCIFICLLLLSATAYGLTLTTTVKPTVQITIPLGNMPSMSEFSKTVNTSNYELLVNTNNTIVTIQPTNVTNSQALFDCYANCTIHNAAGVIAKKRIDILAPTNMIITLPRGAYNIVYEIEGITNELTEELAVSFDIAITKNPVMCTQQFGVAHGYNPANGSVLTVLNTNYSCVTDHRGFCNITMPRGAMYIAHAENVSDMHFWTCEETVVLLRWT
jgi:hypothetical protein